jgi:signal transduction histidine kinase/FixJ family two-component response regulator
VINPGRYALRTAIETLANRPKLALTWARLLMVTTLATVLSGSLYLQSAFDTLRSRNIDAFSLILASRNLQWALECAVADERLARIAGTPAELTLARQDFAHARGEVADAVAGIVAPGVRHLAAGKATALEQAADAAVDRLDRLIPGSPIGRSAADDTDAALIANPVAIAQSIVRSATVTRQAAIARIQWRERLTLALAMLALTLFIILLGGSTARLVKGRVRLLEARRQATHQADLLGGVVEHMRHGVAVFDANDRLTLSNSHLAPVGGLPDELAAPGTFYRAVAGHLSGAEPPLLAIGRPEPGRPVAGEMRLGDRALSVYRTAMPGGGQMLTLADVTERIAAEELIRRAQRMESLGRLTGGVAHDFNNLLQALSTNLEILAAGLSSGGDGRLSALASEAIGAVERGTRLTRHLLAFARRQALASMPLDTDAMLRSLKDLLDRTLGDPIQIGLSIEPGLWPVLADAAGLENALLNLALNARDAMPHGGRLAIAARNEAGADAQSVRITVTDTGVGMTPAQLATAIEPFFTTKPVGVGVGLGLSLVDGFARQSGGWFRLESSVGVGTTAILQLPRAAEAPAADDAAAAPLMRGADELVLLVEDDPVVCRATSEAVEELGYRVVTARDAKTACQMLEAEGLRPDLLFTDVMMPGAIDVSDLAIRARALMPTLPILFNTGDIEAGILNAIVFDDRMRLIAKPWRLSDISRELRRLLGTPDRAENARQDGTNGHSGSQLKAAESAATE